jgi:hypothetical protein
MPALDYPTIPPSLVEYIDPIAKHFWRRFSREKRIHLIEEAREEKEISDKIHPNGRPEFFTDQMKTVAASFTYYARKVLGEITPDTDKRIVEYLCATKGMSAEQVWHMTRKEITKILQEICEGKSSSKNKGSNDDRDKWIYEQCARRTPYKKIVILLKEIADQKGWDVITTKQGIYDAAKRFAKAHCLPSLPRRKE